MDTSNIDYTTLANLCKAASNYERAPRMETFFSIGGRGYYENPTSDVLAFFMSDGEHGLKDVFLGAFLECLDFKEMELHTMLRSEVVIERERKTDQGNRLDIRICGERWALVIENKIYHWIANDLNEYSNSSKRWADSNNIHHDNLHFSILSPSGESPDHKVWKPVRYESLIARARNRISHLWKAGDETKWKIFAEDFLLHLEQEVCYIPMKEKSVKFVDDNLKQLPILRNLQNDYMHYLWKRLEAEVLSDVDEILKPELSWESGFFWIQWGNRTQWQLGLTGPDHVPLGGEGLLIVRIWACPTQADFNSIQSKYFPDPKYKRIGEDEGFVEFNRIFESADAAIKEIAMLARILLKSNASQVVV